MTDLENLTTEQRNKKTMNLDQLSTGEILRLMNDEDKGVPEAISQVLPQIDQAVQATIHAFKKGGRLIYMGAGTSGRLGVLDAAECVPTFSTDPSNVVGLIAGGKQAMTIAVEGAEDSQQLGKQDLQNIQLTDHDLVVGIAASGRTPYVIGGLSYAQKKGASTVSLACNKNAEISNMADIKIEVEVGPEILTGSTRLKSGTAQKLVLNMISTVSMIGIGKVYKNLMVDVKPTNYKLVERSKHIIMEATQCTYQTASDAFEQAGENVKLAIVMLLTNLDYHEARKQLNDVGGYVGKVVQIRGETK
jgi:N-acetylmuramic acid 6-phosphate etherase